MSTDKLNKYEYNHLKVYEEKVKRNIQILMEEGMLNDANQMLKEYSEIVKDDIEIYSIEGNIEILNGNLENAEKIFKSGLEKEKCNFDLSYNLAYLYELKEKYISAYRYYRKALKYASDTNIDLISIKIDEMHKLNDIREYNSRKKVLIIAHIFPPLGGSGVQRTLKFVKYLRLYGWEPIIVTVGNTINNIKDKTLILEIPKDIEIIRIDEKELMDINDIKEVLELQKNIVNDDKIFQEYLRKISNSKKNINEVIFAPDYYILWANEVIKKINDEIDISEINNIYTTSGPYSDHIIGYYLKQKHNKKWVCDFRDEWINNPMANYDINTIEFKIECAMEKSIIKYADKIITTTELARENFINSYNIDEKKITMITNGFDEEDFETINIHANNENEKFTIIHNGMLYGNRTPISFINALRNLIESKKIDRNKIISYFTLTDNDDKYRDYVKSIGLSNNVKFIGQLNHIESLDKASYADLLLLIIGKEQKWKSVYSGKIFEYLKFNKPILALSPSKSIVEKMLVSTKMGENFEFEDEKGIEKYILKLYKRWQNKCNEQIKIDNLSSFERKTLTMNLSYILNQLTVKEKFENRIKQLIKNSKIIEAKKIFEEYIEKFGESIESYSIRGILLVVDENLNEAEICFKQGIDIYGSNFNLNYKLAHIYIIRSNMCKLIGAYKEPYNIFTNEEFEIYKKHIKIQIGKLVDNGELNNAIQIIEQYEKIVQKDIEIYSMRANILIRQGDLESSKKILKKGLSIKNDDFDLLYKLAYIYDIDGNKEEARIIYELLSILQYDSRLSKIIKYRDFKKSDKYKVILYGNDEKCKQIRNMMKNWKVIKISNQTNYIDIFKEYECDFIFVVESVDKNKLLDKNIYARKIYFIDDFKTSIIEGLDYKLLNLFNKSKIQGIITGLSYAEVGIKEELLPYNFVNLALSSQDIYYDLLLIKNLYKFDEVKNNLKYVIINLAYYTFDYDMSMSVGKYRIHRYCKYFKSSVHHNKDKIGLDITRDFYENRISFNHYINLIEERANTKINIYDENAQYEANRNSRMDYYETRCENTIILEDYLSFLENNNIKPIIVICPTSSYYKKYFNDNKKKKIFYEIMNEINLKYDFEIIDFFDNELFSDEDFWDYSHLNGKGARKFTNMIREKIEW
ncbi:hypothetical protein [Clostridium ihumii]|uniref:hypothetical protein n=1 Tax=Clostridium ihumii TaxID=1470356 RepID=UPI0006886610|nr:hypothetical protein [Clostridium ihumii]